MDLGIEGRRAVVCASSKGLGRGCAEALAAAGCALVMNARGADALEEAAEAIRDAHGASVETVAADVTTPEGQRAVIEAAGKPDILVTNAGGPPPGMWHDWGREDFLRALDANMLAPIALMTALLPGMCERGWGRVVNITSQSVKAPVPVLGLSNAARAGLTGYVAGTSRQVAPMGVTINNLLARHPRDREGRRARRGRGQGRGHLAGGGAPEARGDDPRAALRHAGGVRRSLRVPVLGACGLRGGPELAPRRRRHQRHPLTTKGRPRPPLRAFVSWIDQKPNTSATLRRLSVESRSPSASEL